MTRRSRKPEPAKPLTIYLLSGGSGHTADSIVDAALAQFDQVDVQLVRHFRIRSVRKAVQIVKKAADARAILCHTLVEPKIRDAVRQEIHRRMVPAIDVLGSALAVLEEVLQRPSKGRAGLTYERNKDEFDRINAVDFALAHDDGARIDELNQADVVVVGVSRVAKSVVCFYLSYRGIRAANVPIVLGLPLPEEIIKLDARKVIGLSMNAQRLGAIRAARATRMRAGELEAYVDPREIANELRYARHLMNEHGWTCIDASYKATEEVARDVMRAIGR